MNDSFNDTFLRRELGKIMDAFAVRGVAGFGICFKPQTLQLFYGFFQLGKRSARYDQELCLIHKLCSCQSHAAAASRDNNHFFHHKVAPSCSGDFPGFFKPGDFIMNGFPVRTGGVA